MKRVPYDTSKTPADGSSWRDRGSESDQRQSKRIALRQAFPDAASDLPHIPTLEWVADLFARGEIIEVDYDHNFCGAGLFDLKEQERIDRRTRSRRSSRETHWLH